MLLEVIYGLRLLESNIHLSNGHPLPEHAPFWHNGSAVSTGESEIPEA